MALYSLEGIVLKARDFSEADQIITLLSDEKGKLSAIAKGVRRPKSSLASGTRPFTHSRFQLWEGRNLDGVSQVEVVEGFSGLREDLELMACASYVTELVDQFTSENMGQELFPFLLTMLYVLDNFSDPELAVRLFELRLFELTGFGLNWQHCTRCDAGLEEGSQLQFSPRDGGVLCSDCSEEGRQKGRETLALDPGTRSIIRALLRVPLRRLGTIKPSTKQKKQIAEVTKSHILHILERRPRSLNFLEDVLGMMEGGR